MDIKNKFDQTPLDIATLNDDNELIDILSNNHVRQFYLNTEITDTNVYSINKNEDFKKLYLNELKQTSTAFGDNDEANIDHERLKSVTPKIVIERHKGLNTIDSSQELESVSNMAKGFHITRTPPLHGLPNSPRKIADVQSAPEAVSYVLNTSFDEELPVCQGWVYKKKGFGSW
eukprot:CAMPEP_0114655750 /NCGR_PEP_ID=MMETSP0191-20121206/11377_1 /TAXON_ID=126664 /ORGANISM="Sorites sp." /LENGTH=173 /DNA_ID=CAMNT_0001871719 /DNA_START=424 /DNA_END=942 /DNA_ORIENTATION=+